MTVLPSVLDTVHYTRTGQRLNLAEAGAWDLDGYDTERDTDVITSIDGPVDLSAKRMLAKSYPGVAIWQIRPADIDETYRETSRAAYRLCALLHVPERTARAILTIAGTEELGMRYAHGRLVVTGDDDDQTWRIRTVEPDGQEAVVRASFARLEGEPPTGDVPMACTRCGKPVFAGSDGGNTTWFHASTDDYLACPVSDGDPIKARVDA